MAVLQGRRGLFPFLCHHNSKDGRSSQLTVLLIKTGSGKKNKLQSWSEEPLVAPSPGWEAAHAHRHLAFVPGVEAGNGGCSGNLTSSPESWACSCAHRNRTCASRDGSPV